MKPAPEVTDLIDGSIGLHVLHSQTCIDREFVHVDVMHCFSKTAV